MPCLSWMGEDGDLGEDGMALIRNGSRLVVACFQLVCWNFFRARYGHVLEKEPLKQRECERRSNAPRFYGHLTLVLILHHHAEHARFPSLVFSSRFPLITPLGHFGERDELAVVWNDVWDLLYLFLGFARIPLVDRRGLVYSIVGLDRE